MKNLLRRLLCWRGRGAFLDLLAVRFPGRQRALKLELCRIQGRKALVRISLVNGERPLEVLWDWGIQELSDRDGTTWVLVNLDAETQVEVQP